MSILMTNGDVLTNDWSQITNQARVYQTIPVDALINAINKRQAEWLEDGDNAMDTLIPVGNMFEEFAAILADLGVANAYEQMGISESNSYEVIPSNV